MTRVVHCKKEPYDVYIGRPSRWGNPFTHKPGTRAQTVVPTVEAAIECYRDHLWRTIKNGGVELEELAALSGKTLGCWCKPGPCHGDVLAAAAEWAASELKKEA